MTRDLEQAIRWMAEGTKLCRHEVATLGQDAYGEPSGLPGWTRKHVVAHLAANAEALGRLLHWARTGEPAPMYSSPEQRNTDIAAGARLPGTELTAWFERSAGELADAVAGLPANAWSAEVVTAQGRTVPAGEVPWMRSREVMVHTVDLGTGVGFADLPASFLAALREDIVAKRGPDTVPDVRGDLAEITAYLAGRQYTGVTTRDGVPAPALPAWL
jgi:maleylpyruvate isomerase